MGDSRKAMAEAEQEYKDNCRELGIEWNYSSKYGGPYGVHSRWVREILRKLHDVDWEVYARNYDERELVNEIQKKEAELADLKNQLEHLKQTFAESI